MAPIPGIAYAVIGAIIAGSSKFVEIRSGNKMAVFFYIGLIFIAIGIGKIILAKIQSQQNAIHQQPKKLSTNQIMQGRINQNTRPQTTAQRHAGGNPNYQNPPTPQDPRINSIDHRIKKVHATQFQQLPAAQHISIVSCPACGIQHYSYARFCMMCGQALGRK
jgi:hypothetical protein